MARGKDKHIILCSLKHRLLLSFLLDLSCHVEMNIHHVDGQNPAKHRNRFGFDMQWKSLPTAAGSSPSTLQRRKARTTWRALYWPPLSYDQWIGVLIWATAINVSLGAFLGHVPLKGRWWRWYSAHETQWNQQACHTCATGIYPDFHPLEWDSLLSFDP